MATAPAAWQRPEAMKTFLVLVMLFALGVGALFVPVSGRSFWDRAQQHRIPTAVARGAAHGLRATWDFFASLGQRPSQNGATQEAPAHSPRHPSRKAQAQAAAQPPHRTGREGIVPQKPKESLQESDRAALDSLVAHSH